MAQLIKLQDCISRYEWNIYRYPSQFIRLKHDNWKKLYYLWENSNLYDVREEEKESVSFFGKWLPFGEKRKPIESTIEKPSLPETELELRQHFLDKLFPIQMKWATSTVTDVSFLDKSYYDDPVLQYFLQRFPDTYLLLYHPIFHIKNAPIDGEIILISPIGIEIISLLEKSNETTVVAGNDRTWTSEGNRTRANMLSPVIALKRTEQIIKSLLHQAGIDFTISKTVLSRTNHIVVPSEPYKTQIVGKREYKGWFESKRSLFTPLKSTQLKAAEVLLKNSVTTAVKRPEWEQDHAHDFTMGNEEA